MPRWQPTDAELSAIIAEVENATRPMRVVRGWPATNARAESLATNAAEQRFLRERRAALSG